VKEREDGNATAKESRGCEAYVVLGKKKMVTSHRARGGGVPKKTSEIGDREKTGLKGVADGKVY